MVRSFDERCSSCVYWDGEYGEQGRESEGKCRRRVAPVSIPPVNTGRMMTPRIASSFAPTIAMDWCGDFEGRYPSGNSGY